MEHFKMHTLAVLVDNEAGVLSQVSRLFSRKGYNIESLAVGPTDDLTISRMTIEVLADCDMVNLLCNQLRKLTSVHSVKLLTEESVRRKLVLIKVAAATSEVRNEVMQIANIFRANIIDVSIQTLTIAVIGQEGKIDSIHKLLQEFGVLELVQTGIVAIERGITTINDDTKEKGEFNYGKNVL